MKFIVKTSVKYIPRTIQSHKAIMRPIKVNWDKKLPTDTLIEEMWQTLKFQLVEMEFEYINLLKENLNGNVYFHGFQFEENEVFDWYISRGRPEEIDFFSKFLLSEKVLSTFSDNKNSNLSNLTEHNLKITAIDKTPKFNSEDGFILDGVLASLLYYGGAYGSTYNRKPTAVKEKARKFCQQLFDEKYNYDNMKYFQSNQAWNSWFIDFIIDNTYLVFCFQTRTLWMLAYTDTD